MFPAAIISWIAPARQKCTAYILLPAEVSYPCHITTGLLSCAFPAQKEGMDAIADWNRKYGPVCG